MSGVGITVHAAEPAGAATAGGGENLVFQINRNICLWYIFIFC